MRSVILAHEVDFDGWANRRTLLGARGSAA